MPDASDKVVLSQHQVRFGLTVVAGIAVVILVAGGAIRFMDSKDLSKRSTADTQLTVAVIHPGQDKGGRNLTLPGTIEAWQLAPVYARTNGYLKAWNVDIGAKVKEGQVLAEIDAPELDQQLAAAQANLATANANRDLAATTADRWQKLVDKDAVSRQEADEKRGELAARNAMANSARAEVDRLRALEGFKHIVAPFAGTVTSRSTDVGALISANGGSQPLFTVADMHKMRIYVHVPQSYSTEIKTGMTATLNMPEYPDRTFTAKMERSAGAVSDTSGTVLAQLTVDNQDGALQSGAYTDVNFTLPPRTNVVNVPASALIIGKGGVLVAVVDDHNKVTLKPVVIAQDLGNSVDIGSGLTAADAVIDNPPESIATGDEVHLSGGKEKTGNVPA